uniref:Uncharacterized protein n=1 Tax=Arundo donax TaxID=35708 RepID=A0A0A9HPF7_ARUDO
MYDPPREHCSNENMMYPDQQEFASRIELQASHRLSWSNNMSLKVLLSIL